MHSDPNAFCRGMPGDFTEGQQDGVFWSTAAHPFVSNQKGWFAAAEQEVDKNAEPNWWCAPWQLWVYGASRHREIQLGNHKALLWDLCHSVGWTWVDQAVPLYSSCFTSGAKPPACHSIPLLHYHQSTTGHKSPLPTSERSRAELHTALCTHMRHLVLNNPLPTP